MAAKASRSQVAEGPGFKRGSAPRRIKGPLTITDMIMFNMGRGSPFIRAHKFAYAYRDKHPGAYPIDEQMGIPDVVERVHWSDELARKTGNPAPYDYGAQRVGWLCQLIANSGSIRPPIPI